MRLVALLAALAVGAPIAHAKPRPPSRMQVTSSEFEFVVSRAKLRQGRAIVELVNLGEDPHDLALRRTARGARTYSTPEVLPCGERTISLDDLFVAPFMTTLQPNEIVTEVRVPSPGRRAAGTYLKLERKVGDYATVAVAVHVSFADDDTVERAGIALTGVGPTNLRARRAEDALRGRALDDEAIGEAARLAAEEAQPFDDIRGTVDYKRNMVRVYTERGLQKARDQEGGSA